MEPWQKAFVRKELPYLIQNTRCSPLLKAGLKAKELLSDEEDERLTALAQNHGHICAAKDLYDIIVSKCGGYHGLMQVFQDTRQHKALQILQYGLHQEKEFATCVDDPTTLVKGLTVKISGATKKFSDVFPKITGEDVVELLRDTEVKLEFDQLVLNPSKVLDLDGYLPVPQYTYIDRFISNRLQLNPEAFTLQNCSDIFVFTNIERKELAKLVKPFATRSSTNQRSLVTSRHIYLDHEDDWADLVFVSKHPIHLISKEDGGYILQRTTQVTNILLRYASDEGRSKEAFVSEDKFVELLASGSDSEGALICDVPGMGKTWLMQRLAMKLREKCANSIVFFNELTTFGIFLEKNPPILENSQALNIVLEHVCESKFASHLLRQHASSSGLNFLFLFDGFDELSESDSNVITSVLSNLSAADNVQLIISSRPHLRAELQKTFNLIAYDIKPFDREEQVCSIVGYWLKELPETEMNSLNDFAVQCIESVKTIQNGNSRDLLGVPLKCRILAAVNEKQALQLCKTNFRIKIIPETATLKSVFDLFTKFVDKLVDKVAQNNLENTGPDFARQCSMFHTHLALNLLFPELSTVYLGNHNSVKKVDQELVNRVGIACFNGTKNSFEFLHRSFAEYFVGKFFAEFWSKTRQYDPTFVTEVGVYFIHKVIEVREGPDPIEEFSWIHLFHSLTFAKMDLHQDWPYMYFKRLCHFRQPTVLWFMNSAYKKTSELSSIEWFKNGIVSQKPVTSFLTKSLKFFARSKKKRFRTFKKRLIRAAYSTILACIGDELSSLLSLYVQILIAFIEESTRIQILIQDDPFFEKFQVGVMWLLCSVGMTDSPDMAVDIFKLFDYAEDNLLRQFCENYPISNWSPLDVAIETQNLDMVVYFVDKVKQPTYRLFVSCVATHHITDLTDAEIDMAINIMEVVFGSIDNLLDYLATPMFDFTFDWDIVFFNYRFQILSRYIVKSNRSFKSIHLENKRFILGKSLMTTHDADLMYLLLCFCGYIGPERNSSNNSVLGEYETKALTAEAVLEKLDLVEIRDVFSKFRLHRGAFQCCLKIDTIRVLTSILSDFSICNVDNWNYLHYSVHNGNIDWVKYLIDTGSDINQRDKHGNTPLLCSSFSRPEDFMKTTSILVENGVDTHVQNNVGQNIAHLVFAAWKCFKQEELCGFVSYLLEIGHGKLFEIRDKDGRLPHDIPINEAGENDPMTTKVLRLLQRTPN